MENMMGPLLVHVYEVINMRELLERLRGMLELGQTEGEQGVKLGTVQ